MPAGLTPWQRLTPEQLEQLGLTRDDVRCAAWWIDETGRRSRGHLAIGRALAAASGLWRVLGLLLLVPPLRWLAAAAYPLVARLRHCLPGGTPGCRM